MLTYLPAILLIVALIYLLYARMQIRKIHSVQRVIEFHHSKAPWRFQQKEYEANEAELSHLRKFGALSLWIAVCSLLELSLGHYPQAAFPDVYIDYYILFIGCIGGVVIWFYMGHNGGFLTSVCNLWNCWVANILTFCTIFAFQWEIAAFIVCCVIAWLISPFGRQEA